MSLEAALQRYPRKTTLKDGTACQIRPLKRSDESVFFQFFQELSDHERLFLKHRVTEPEVVREWCQNIDPNRNLPLLTFHGQVVLAAATLHQQLGGWKRHIGRVSVLVHNRWRNRGLARALLAEIIDLARAAGLEKLEAEFIDEQEAAMKVFGLAAFRQILREEEYVKDMQAISHDYIVMSLELLTDEEYAGAG
jgi:L-amino acid N-acyltransferase YncA